MNDKDQKRLDDNAALLAELGVVDAPLRWKYRRVVSITGRKGGARGGNGGGVGRAARRAGGWSKHGKSAANISAGRLTLKAKRALERAASATA